MFCRAIIFILFILSINTTFSNSDIKKHIAFLEEGNPETVQFVLNNFYTNLGKLRKGKDKEVAKYIDSLLVALAKKPDYLVSVDTVSLDVLSNWYINNKEYNRDRKFYQRFAKNILKNKKEIKNKELNAKLNEFRVLTFSKLMDYTDIPLAEKILAEVDMGNIDKLLATVFYERLLNFYRYKWDRPNFEKTLKKLNNKNLVALEKIRFELDMGNFKKVISMADQAIKDKSYDKISKPVIFFLAGLAAFYSKQNELARSYIKKIEKEKAPFTKVMTMVLDLKTTMQSKKSYAVKLSKEILKVNIDLAFHGYNTGLLLYLNPLKASILSNNKSLFREARKRTLDSLKFVSPSYLYNDYAITWIKLGDKKFGFANSTKLELRKMLKKVAEVIGSRHGNVLFLRETLERELK